MRLTTMWRGALRSCALVGPMALLVHAAPPASVRATTSSLAVYVDALAQGWSDWSWGTTVDWADTSGPHSGSDDVAFTYTGGWSALSVHADSQIDTTPYDQLLFWINGGSAGGQSLTVYLEDNGNSLSDPVDITPYIQGGGIASNTWREVDIPLSDLGASATTIDRIDLFDNTDSAQPEMLLDDLALYDDGQPPPPPKHGHVTVTVNATADRHTISPYIYGVAFGGSFLKSNNVPLDRWGGNSVSRYNWKLGSATNTASDWYFENVDANNDDCSTPGCAVDDFVSGDRAAGAASLITVPTIGWVAKNADLNTCGFKVSKYGAQQATDPYRPNCGNGVDQTGDPITGNDPSDTSVKSTPADIKSWIQHIVGKFGTAATGGVKFYAMDNEPELWYSTHRDVAPDPLTYQGLYNEFENYATVVKEVDPSAKLDGPVPWGWSAYFDSSYDYANNTESDRNAHGNMPIIPWFLKKVRAHDLATGHRTLNVLDIHYYPQGSGVFGDNNSPTTDALRLRETRALWDPTYRDESWINAKVDLIPRMQAWIAKYYPGTKLGISEWNFGDDSAMNGALAIADVLGTYGRMGVYLADYWTTPPAGSPGALAFDLFRDYDGQDSTFGDESVKTTSSTPKTLMAFGSTRSSDGRMLVLLVNQQRDTLQRVTLRVKNFAMGSNAEEYGLGPGDTAIQAKGNVPASASMTVKVPPNSIELLSIPAA